jgi:hypothetical protein
MDKQTTLSLMENFLRTLVPKRLTKPIFKAAEKLSKARYRYMDSLVTPKYQSLPKQPKTYPVDSI